MYEALIKMLVQRQSEIAAKIVSEPLDAPTYRFTQGRWAGIGDALAEIKTIQDGQDRVDDKR